MGGNKNQDVGWYVGYLESNDNVYYFSNCIQLDSQIPENTDRAILFDKSRMEIVLKYLKNFN